MEELNVMAMDMRDKVDNIRNMVCDLHDEIYDLIVDYIIASKISEKNGQEFSEDYIEDYMGWISTLEELKNEIENTDLLK